MVTSQKQIEPDINQVRLWDFLLLQKSIVSIIQESILATRNRVIRFPMPITSMTKVGIEIGECMQYNNVITMHTYDGEIYMI